jgi:hypothetical protein
MSKDTTDILPDRRRVLVGIERGGYWHGIAEEFGNPQSADDVERFRSTCRPDIEEAIRNRLAGSATISP